MQPPPPHLSPPVPLPLNAWEVSMKKGKKEKKKYDIKITKHALRYYTCIDLFLKHSLV